jgi:type I restriction enzyme S subunit
MSLMKDSGVNWLHEIPSDWQTLKLLYCLREPICDGPHETPNYIENGIPFISVDSLNDSKDINFEIVKKFISEQQYQTYMMKAKLEVGDILFSKAATIGKTAIVPNEKFMIWSPLAVIKNNPDVINNNFLYYLLNCAELITAIRLSGSYNTQANVGMREMERAIIPVPPLEVQKSIANFLDQKCSEIDSLSTDIQSQIDVLEEYKKSVITEAVTKGLNPDVEMKDSGIEWIGMIPKHWDISRLKHCLSKNDGGVWGNEPNNSDGDKIVLRSTEQTIDGYWNIADPAVRNIGNHCKQYQILCGDLLITKSSGSSLHIGKTTLADEYFNHNECYYSNFLQRLRANEKVVPKFLWYLMNNPIVRNQFVFMQNSTIGIGNINADNINAIVIPVPSIQEQMTINQYLDTKCSEINAVIADKKAQLETLAEYKKSLIYEYVTGKKEVPDNV